MKRILSTIALVVVAALLFWASQPDQVISQTKPYMSSLFVATKIVNSGYMTVADSLRVGGAVTFNGAATFNSTVSWPDSFFGHIVVTDSARLPQTIFNGNVTLNDSFSLGTGGGFGTITPLATGVHDIGTDVNAWDSLFIGHVKATNVNVSGASTFSTVGALTPSSADNLDIGTDVVKWDSVFAGHVKTTNLDASGAVATGALTITGNASPEADGTRDLGTDVAKWDSVFAGHVKTTNLNASGAATFSTTIGVSGAATLDSVYARKLVLNAGTKQIIDSISAVHADTLAVWVGGKAFVLPVRP